MDTNKTIDTTLAIITNCYTACVTPTSTARLLAHLADYTNVQDLMAAVYVDSVISPISPDERKTKRGRICFPFFRSTKRVTMFKRGMLLETSDLKRESNSFISRLTGSLISSNLIIVLIRKIKGRKKNAESYNISHRGLLHIKYLKY